MAHWCLAGSQRRQLDDYGYWYAEDGRSQDQQHKFFKVEVKPQTIEKAFCLVLSIHFEPSLDNLSSEVHGLDEFNDEINNQLHAFIKDGFPNRAHIILECFANHKGISNFKEHIFHQK